MNIPKGYELINDKAYIFGTLDIYSAEHPYGINANSDYYNMSYKIPLPINLSKLLTVNVNYIVDEKNASESNNISRHMGIYGETMCYFDFSVMENFRYIVVKINVKKEIYDAIVSYMEKNPEKEYSGSYVVHYYIKGII